jgi:hypothetical protein
MLRKVLTVLPMAAMSGTAYAHGDFGRAMEGLTLWTVGACGIFGLFSGSVTALRRFPLLRAFAVSSIAVVVAVFLVYLQLEWFVLFFVGIGLLGMAMTYLPTYAFIIWRRADRSNPALNADARQEQPRAG